MREEERGEGGGGGRSTLTPIPTWDILHGAKGKGFLNLVLFPNLIP